LPSVRQKKSGACQKRQSDLNQQNVINNAAGSVSWLAAKKQKTNEGYKMKTMNNKNLVCAGVAIAMAFAAWLPTTATAADEPMKPMKAGEHMLMMNKLDTKEQADAMKPDDTMAMVCAKCKTVYITRVKQGMKGAEIMMAGGQTTELIGTHGCPGCKGTVTITGIGKGKETTLKHSCSMCGDDSAFCCATKPGAGATTGMEKK